jgi:hypothetical protein
LLLHEAGLAEVPSSGDAAASAAEPSAGIYFARTRDRPEMLGRFARDLCRRLGVEGRWLPWGNRAAFAGLDVARMRKAFPQMRVGPGPEASSVADVLATMGGCRLVVSDTYHLCVNAWRLGVPAICIGDETPDAAWNWNSGHAFSWRDKRRTFYAMYDALEYFVQTRELENRRTRARRLDQLVALMADPGLARNIAGTIAGRAATAEKQLIAAMRRRLGGAHPDVSRPRVYRAR